MSEFIKHDAEKPDLTLLFDAPNALLGITKVLEFGAKKYARGNWKLCKDTTRYRKALLRHFLALQNGELLDPETGLPHVYHIACNALFLAELEGGEAEFVKDGLPPFTEGDYVDISKIHISAPFYVGEEPSSAVFAKLVEDIEKI